MRRHIPPEIKRLVLRLAIIRKYPYKKILRITGVGARSIMRIRSLYRRTGNVVAKRIVDGRPRILNGFEVSVRLRLFSFLEMDFLNVGVTAAQFLEGCIEQKPDLMLSELQDRLRGSCGVDVSPITIYRTLKRRGFTRKKMTRPAVERDETDRAEYQLLIGTYYEPEQLVFVDESAFDRRTVGRAYGWAPIGTRGRRRDFFVRGKR
jgi:transposase